MTEQTVRQPVHLYLPKGRTFDERIMCGHPDKGINTHVTEYGTQVTCPACLDLMRVAEQQRGES